MYYPYFRGKQNELITIRENAALLKDAGFVPIIEPVKETLSGLNKTLDAIANAEGEAILIVNPYHGDHSHNAENIQSLFQQKLKDSPKISPGILLTEDVSVDQAIVLCDEFQERAVTLIHFGFTEAKQLAERLGEKVTKICHVFLEDSCGKLYRRHFNGAKRVLLRDGFQKRTNREHPPVEFFSDLHATFQEEGMDGFGDFLIVGDEYSESGGPAYAVAIHLTFIDPDKDDEMHIHHFKSIRQDDPKDPAGKFMEALNEMVGELKQPNTKIFKSDSVNEFLDLHARGHFPGLGYVKKLSMKHHVETLANYFNQR